MMPIDRRRGLALVPILVIAGAVLVAGACAVTLALLMTGGSSAHKTETAASSDAPKAQEPCAFVPFGDAIANLTEDRLTRYVKVNITLEVDPLRADAMQKLMTGPTKAVFRNWLITYLSDKQLQDVKGANAMNRLRREILDGFNAILAEQGDLKVQRVLFEEFNVQ
jgi:flagellar basal body-associated protein FliL